MCANLVLPTLTNTPDQTKSTVSQGGSDAYQTLPDPVLAERIALVFLVWSGAALPFFTMALYVPDDAFWLVWILLPIVTMSPFWVHTYRR